MNYLDSGPSLIFALDVSKGFNVSHIAAQSIKRPPYHQRPWSAWYCPRLVTKRCRSLHNLLVSVFTQPLNLTRHGALPYSTAHQCQTEPRTYHLSAFRTALWPRRHPQCTASRCRQHDQTVGRSNRLYHNGFSLLSTCCVCMGRLRPARIITLCFPRGWHSVTKAISYERSSSQEGLGKRSSCGRIRILIRFDYISDSARMSRLMVQGYY